MQYNSWQAHAIFETQISNMKPVVKWPLMEVLWLMGFHSPLWTWSIEFQRINMKCQRDCTGLVKKGWIYISALVRMYLYILGKLCSTWIFINSNTRHLETTLIITATSNWHYCSLITSYYTGKKNRNQVKDDWNNHPSWPSQEHRDFYTYAAFT